jgi:predicted DNA-binding transcriptional regulator AlpA
MAPHLEILLDSYELATILKLSKKTVQRDRIRGRGPAFIRLPNGYVRYRQRDIDAWLERQRRTASATNG